MLSAIGKKLVVVSVLCAVVFKRPVFHLGSDNLDEIPFLQIYQGKDASACIRDRGGCYPVFTKVFFGLLENHSLIEWPGLESNQ